MIKMKIDVDDKNFEEEVIKKSEDKPVVVDFWASWCMPCNMLGPVLENLTEKNQEKFILAKVNVDNAPKVSAQYSIRSIPAVKLFKGGKVIDEFVGALPEPAVSEWLNKNL